ncbi:hypothetical protein BofuT4_P082680.1 [Botrytis cinerea T4]|uniref:Uncharacterized protein n=1 Tax=Botryotinia fuckeliana (strain T4) TaxID=999810 RepID=G2YKG1_BOTF4|nr:hypothetical protein BofuT4_P082680.1 [Botrytis cinerea T4]
MSILFITSSAYLCILNGRFKVLLGHTVKSRNKYHQVIWEGLKPKSRIRNVMQ